MPTTPRLIGYRRDGRPIHLIGGASEPTVAQPPTTPPAPTPAPPAQPPAPPAAPADSTDWKAEARKWEDRAKENKGAADELEQLKAAQAAQLDDIAKRLGLKPTEADPAQLAEQLTAAKADATDARTQLAIFKAASEHGADPGALLDSTSAMAEVAKVDPADKEALGKAIAAAVEANPRIKAQQQAPAGRSSAPAGGEPAKAQLTRTDLQNMTPDEINAARKEGRLRSLLGG